MPYSVLFAYFQLMLDTWNESIFSNIKSRLQDSAMKLVHAERLGEAFDSQLVIGVRESYGERVDIVISLVELFGLLLLLFAQTSLWVSVGFRR